MRQQSIPPEVVAAIAAALGEALQVPPDRLRMRLSGPAPADDARGPWQLLSTFDQMRGRRGLR